MTDDLVARLRNNAACDVMVAPHKLLAEAADRLEAAEAEIVVKERAIAEAARLAHKLMTRALAAEARVRELEDRVGVLEHDLDAQIAGHRLSANEATKHLMRIRELEAMLADQRTIAKYNREQAEAVERRLAEAYERAAKVADGWLAQFAHHEIKYISARMYASDAIQDIATAIRKLAQEERHAKAE